MKKLLVYLKDYKKETILAPLFKMLEASFELFIPLVVAAIVDTGIHNADHGYIIRMCLLMIALGVIGLTCSLTAQFFAAKAAVGFSARLKHALFSHMQSLSFSEIDTLGTSAMITRMTSDMNQVQSGVNLVLRLFLRSPFIVFGAMIMAFTINFKCALIFAVTIPLLSLVVFSVMLFNIPIFKKVQAGLDTILLRTRENLTGVRVIRAFHKEEDEINRFETDNRALTKIQMFAGRVSALMNPVTYVIINLATVFLVWKGAVFVDSAVITQGEVIALVNYMSQILVELIKLANLIITVTKAVACGSRIQAVFEISSGVSEIKSELNNSYSSDYSVCFDHVSLTYKKAGDESLSDIDFKVKKGQTVGIIGGTGSGKSSLVHLIPRFYDATKGGVYVDGRNVCDYTLDELRSKIGIVMQKAVLFKGTLRDNLLWGNENATDEEMYRALEIAQAKEFVDAKGQGLELSIAQGGKNLSGGQKQRLTIARAIVKNPQILILDDSASALDLATDARLRSAIRTLEKDMTVFIVSQRAASIQHADLILVMEDGKTAGMGTHEQLLQTCSVYQEIYYSQFPKEA